MLLAVYLLAQVQPRLHPWRLLICIAHRILTSTYHTMSYLQPQGCMLMLRRTLLDCCQFPGLGFFVSP